MKLTHNKNAYTVLLFYIWYVLNDSNIYNDMVWVYVDMWFNLLCFVMIYLWYIYVDVITYDGISWCETCGNCMHILRHAWSSYLLFKMLWLTMMLCSHYDMQELVCGLFSMVLWCYN